MMTPTEIQFYRELYKVISNPDIEQLFVKYAQIHYNKAIFKTRTEQTLYAYGYNNGSADAWEAILNLKQNVTKIMNNIG